MLSIASASKAWRASKIRQTFQGNRHWVQTRNNTNNFLVKVKVGDTEISVKYTSLDTLVVNVNIALLGIEGSFNISSELSSFWNNIFGSNKAKTTASADKTSSLYDLIYDFESIGAGQKDKCAWELKILNSNSIPTPQNGESPKISNEMDVVGIVGTFSTGKTWLVNKLTTSTFEMGEAPVTRGISVKLPTPLCPPGKLKHMILDTAGTNVPVVIDGDNQLVNDALVTEQILRDTLLQVSNHCIYVTQNLSTRDQKVINDLARAKSTLFIVHNLRGTVVHSFASVVKQILLVKQLYPRSSLRVPGQTFMASEIPTIDATDTALQNWYNQLKERLGKDVALALRVLPTKDHKAVEHFFFVNDSESASVGRKWNSLAAEFLITSLNGSSTEIPQEPLELLSVALSQNIITHTRPKCAADPQSEVKLKLCDYTEADLKKPYLSFPVKWFVGNKEIEMPSTELTFSPSRVQDERLVVTSSLGVPFTKRGNRYLTTEGYVYVFEIPGGGTESRFQLQPINDYRMMEVTVDTPLIDGTSIENIPDTDPMSIQEAKFDFPVPVGYSAWSKSHYKSEWKNGRLFVTFFNAPTNE